MFYLEEVVREVDHCLGLGEQLRQLKAFDYVIVVQVLRTAQYKSTPTLTDTAAHSHFITNKTRNVGLSLRNVATFVPFLFRDFVHTIEGITAGRVLSYYFRVLEFRVFGFRA